MSKLIEKAASPEVMNAAWKRCSNNNTIWTNGVSRKQMESNQVYYLLKLADELRTGVYKPDPVRFFPVNKGNGKQRIISANTLRDKVAQRAVLTVIEPIGEKNFHHDSFGYRPGRTISMALSRVREYMLCGMTWVIDADIQRYFDNIPHRLLIKSVKKMFHDQKLIRIIQNWLDAGIIKRGFISSPKGIPQGAVISPFLCNVYLTSWDNYMSAMNLPFVRFADDFLIFAKSGPDAVKAYPCVKRSLKRLGLMLNKKKTRTVKCGPKVQFLGRKLPKLKSVTIL